MSVPMDNIINIFYVCIWLKFVDEQRFNVYISLGGISW